MSPEVYKNRVAKMEAELEDESVAFNNFMKAFKENQQRFFLFLEGNDDIDYYQISFDSILGIEEENWKDIICHGRDKVIKLIATLTNHKNDYYRNSFYYGFIDKDYNEISENNFKERIYITPYYSIENFYLTESFLEKILIRKFYLPKNDDENKDFHFCIDLFKNRITSFIESIKEIDLILRANHLMYKNGIGEKINISSISLDKFYEIYLNQVRNKFSSPEQVLDVDLSIIDIDALNNSTSYYKGKSYQALSLQIRGKFMIYFMHNFIFRLKEDQLYQSKRYAFPYLKSLPKDKQKLLRMNNISLKLEAKDFMSIFAQYAERPECLYSFLHEIKKRRLI